MSDDFGNDIIELTDEEGNILSLEHLDTVEYQGEVYMAFIPAEMTLEESYELVILKVETEENGDEALVTLEDEDELAMLFQIFSERLEESFEAEGETPAEH